MLSNTLAAASSGDRTVHIANSDGKSAPARKNIEHEKHKARHKSPSAERTRKRRTKPPAPHKARDKSPHISPAPVASELSRELWNAERG